MSEWLTLWIQRPELHRPVSAAWEGILNHILVQGKVRLRRVKGPVAAIIGTLLGAGWTCPSPTHWTRRTSDGEVDWMSPQFDTPEFGQVDIAQVVGEFASGLRCQLWKNAAKFEGDYNLEHGADFSQVSGELRKYGRADGIDNWGLTITAATGGQWTRERQRAQG
eukprot:4253782-Pyramimonas_sp.AAC.2